MPVEGFRLRLVTAVLVVVPLAIVVFFMPRIYGVLVLALMAMAGAWEWGGFFSRATTMRRMLLVAVIGAGLALAWFSRDEALMPILWVAVGWWLLAFIWLLRFPTPVPAWMILLGSFLVLIPGWLALARLHMVYGPQWLAFFFLIIAAADSGAYIAGKSIGKTRLAPNVSPGKTWEGAGGGLLFAGVIAGIGAYLFRLSPVFLVSLCFSVALASVVGDLTISMFKRNAGLKDSGRLFPGHGGVLDRIDSISAGAPLFVIGLGWIDHIA